MPALRRSVPSLALAPLPWVFAFAVAVGASCKAKASAVQCDQLLDRYAGLVVTERYADAGAAQIESERAREKSEAHGDDAFKNCSSEVSKSEFECAMRSASADAFLKCLE